MEPVAYVEHALRAEVDRVASAPEKQRHPALFLAAANLGELVGAGALAEARVWQELEAAAEACGLTRGKRSQEVRRTISDGLRRGLQNPRELPAEVRAALAGAGPTRSGRPAPPPAAPRPPPEPERRYPPADEVRRVWSSCAPVGDDHEVAGWLRTRGLDPARVHDLVRALPERPHAPPWLPGWMHRDYRAVLPAWDAHGQLRSLRFRAICGAEVKARPPNGKADPRNEADGERRSYSVAGLLLACPVGRWLLADAPKLRDVWDGRVVVTEGEPDFLTWATRSAVAPAPAVFGLWSGSWTPELAARIPDGARVVVRTHHDGTGAKYARAVVETLTGRCDVRRSRPVARPA